MWGWDGFSPWLVWRRRGREENRRNKRKLCPRIGVRIRSVRPSKNYYMNFHSSFRNDSNIFFNMSEISCARQTWSCLDRLLHSFIQISSFSDREREREWFYLVICKWEANLGRNLINAFWSVWLVWVSAGLGSRLLLQFEIEIRDRNLALAHPQAVCRESWAA